MAPKGRTFNSIPQQTCEQHRYSVLSLTKIHLTGRVSAQKVSGPRGVRPRTIRAVIQFERKPIKKAVDALDSQHVQIFLTEVSEVGRPD